MKLCYDCGNPIDPKEEDKEHIPQKCLLNDVPTHKRNSFITIPAHIACNHKYSTIDNVIRDIIGLSSNEESKTTGKSIRSLLRQSDEQVMSKVSFEKNEAYIDFNYDDIRKSHIKNFKGIFYKEYGLPLPKDFKVDVLTDSDKLDEFENEIIACEKLLRSSESKISISGTPETFQARTIVSSNEGPTLEFNGDIVLVVSELVYHNKMFALVIAKRRI